MMRKKVFWLVVLLLVATSFVTSCGTRQSATSNSKMSKVSSTEQSTQSKSVNTHAIVKENSTYDCDIAADKAAYDGHVDITVGDNLFATQINDWYMYFDQYAGKVVEIEGYYIGDFQPYDFVGRHGPVCPYCQGGYVSFEILSDEDMKQYQSVKDWIKVTGILRQGVDSQKGPFYYIEALKIEKMPKVGVDTVTN
jgi:uncharacterized membrane protein YcgQ (UPF0703/DUF1980 family)